MCPRVADCAGEVTGPKLLSAEELFKASSEAAEESEAVCRCAVRASAFGLTAAAAVLALLLPLLLAGTGVLAGVMRAAIIFGQGVLAAALSVADASGVSRRFHQTRPALSCAALMEWRNCCMARGVETSAMMIKDKVANRLWLFICSYLPSVVIEV